MAAKKEKIPEHIKQKQKKFCDPKADHPIIKIFNEIEDARKPSLTFCYSLTCIFVVHPPCDFPILFNSFPSIAPIAC